MSNISVCEKKNGIEVSLNGSVVKINPINSGRYTTYRLTWHVGDRRFRVSRSKKEEALALAKEKVRHLARAEGERTTVEASRIVYLRECERSVQPYPLHEVCEFFRKFHNVGGPQKKLGDICDEYKLTVEAKGLSKAHKNSVSTQVRVFKSWFPKQSMQQITAGQLEENLSETSFSPYTKKKLVDFYRTLENFARKKRYLPRDYETITQGVTLPAVPNVNYPVFTPEEMMRLFIILQPHEIAYVATMAFGGSRRAEFERMTPEHFDSEEQSARIDKEIAKKKMPRHLHMPDNLIEWLKVAKLPEHGKIISHRKIAAISRDKLRLKQVGLVWKQNILRHSFLSYHLAKHENPGVTAYVGGTSIKMLAAHYVTLVSKRAAEEYFNITPSTVRDYAEKEGLTGLLHW